MSLVRELVKAARLRDWAAIDAAIEHERWGHSREAIRQGEADAKQALSPPPSLDLPDGLAAAVWADFKAAPAGPGVRK